MRSARPVLLTLAILLAGILITADGFSCTNIIIGREASVDGSVITSHTGCAPDCRVHVVPAMTHEKGTMAPVFFGILDATVPFRQYGEVIGHIPQAEQTYRYFHSAYSHMNEHQLAIAESTMSQRPELAVERTDEFVPKQIMTIEQAQAFAMQRCRTAREAITLIGSLMDKYGFLPSSGPNPEALCIADSREAWVFEVFSVEKEWSPESGRAGAIWAAQRVPDDHVAVVPNWSIIKEIDPSQADRFMVSGNYLQEAVDRGWYDPKGGKPFVWQNVYAPTVTSERATGCI